MIFIFKKETKNSLFFSDFACFFVEIYPETKIIIEVKSKNQNEQIQNNKKELACIYKKREIVFHIRSSYLILYGSN